MAPIVDLRQHLLPVRNQGRRPSCLAFASSTAHEYRITPMAYLSVEYLYYCSIARMRGSLVGGTTMPAMASALGQDGQPDEGAWPYSPTQQTPWLPPSISGPLYKANMQLGALSYDEVVAVLSAGQPIVLGLIVTDAFYAPDASGVVRSQAVDPERGGHAVLAVGHGKSPTLGEAILIRNSWGSAWGSSGYGWLLRSYAERQLRETAFLI